MRLKDKIAFITGGNSGIGLATALLFVKQGAQVAITRLPGEALNESLAALGDRVLAVDCDVTDVPTIETAVAAAVDRFGRLDIVFANAGIVAATPLGHATVDTFERILRVNVIGTFFTIQAAAPHLESGASVIITGSNTAVLGTAMLGAYAASKGAVSSMSRVIATELSQRNIRVNVIVPGAAHTPIWNSLVEAPADVPAFEKKIEALIPLGRLNTADEVAQTVLFLASDESSSIHAAEIVIDGGAAGAPHAFPALRNWRED